MIDRSKYEEEEDEEEQENWLASYSDLVTDLMAVFVLLFSFALLAMAQQNQKTDDMIKTPSGADQVKSTGEYIEETVGYPGVGQGDYLEDDELDLVFQTIKEKVEDSNYADVIGLERNPGYIKFRFKDNMLFYPDSAEMKSSSYDILEYMGDLLASVSQHISSIEISGHTADAGGLKNGKYFAWELSSDRAISVLKFLAEKCDFPESKMVTSGHSHYSPVAENDSEEGQSQNRRVELKIIRVLDDTEEEFEP